MNFILRPWTIRDLKDLVKFANNKNISRNLTNLFPYPYTEANGRAFIEMAIRDKPIHIFAIEIEGAASGGIGIHLQSDIMCKNAELGYWLAEPFWGKGIITNAVKQMIEFGFKTYDIDRIFARPFGTNAASQKVLEKAGFVLEARLKKTIFKDGKYLDELIYAVRRDEVKIH